MISTIYIMARRWKRCKFFGPGKFLFSRALKQELRMQHELQVLIRHLAQKMLQNKYPEWLDLACHLQKRRTEKKYLLRVYLMLYREMLYLHSHKKVCGYQNWTFALGVFECLDTYSRKSLFLCVGYSN